MQKTWSVSSSPHVRDNSSTRRIMIDVCIALIPAGLAGIWFFGLQALGLIIASVLSCIVAEGAYQKITGQRITVSDGSAAVTGLLLAYNLPANAPVWLAIIGAVIAIILVKQIFGGIGNNFMNPALAARVILFISFMAIMTNYPLPREGADQIFGFKLFNGDLALTSIDTMGSATPIISKNAKLIDLFIGNVGGVLGETSKIAILIGGVYLLIRRVIDWRIPLTFIASAFVCYLIKDGAYMALYHTLSGGLLLGAVFMATDYATSPMTKWGRVIMGIGCGVLLFVIREFSTYPEGCSFAILFMNVLTPLIDKFTIPKTFGEVKQRGQ